MQSDLVLEANPLQTGNKGTPKESLHGLSLVSPYRRARRPICLRLHPSSKNRGSKVPRGEVSCGLPMDFAGTAVSLGSDKGSTDVLGSWKTSEHICPAMKMIALKINKASKKSTWSFHDPFKMGPLP